MTTSEATPSALLPADEHGGWDSVDELGQLVRFHTWAPRVDSYASLMWRETKTRTGVHVSGPWVDLPERRGPLSMAAAARLADDVAACLARVA